MSDINPGDYVVAIEKGTAQLARGYGRVSYSAGDELQVTSMRSSTINVRPVRGGRVFTIARTHVQKPARKIGEIPPGGIAPEDPRIAWIFDDAARLANRLGLCPDFDRIMDALGAPGRTRTFKVDVASEDGITITATIEARSRRLAESKLREKLGATAPLQLMEATR